MFQFYSPWAPLFTIFLNTPSGGRQSHASGLSKLPFNLFQYFTIMKQITSSSIDNCYNHITVYVMLCIVPPGSMFIYPCLHMLWPYILKCLLPSFGIHERGLCDVFSFQRRETSHMNSCLISCTLILNTKNRVYSEYRLNLVFDGKIAHMGME